MFWRKESLDNVRFQNDRFDAQLLALDKCVTGRLDAAWRRTDRHRDELERLKDSVQELEGRILKLESKKIALSSGWSDCPSESVAAPERTLVRLAKALQWCCTR